MVTSTPFFFFASCNFSLARNNEEGLTEARPFVCSNKPRSGKWVVGRGFKSAAAGSGFTCEWIMKIFLHPRTERARETFAKRARDRKLPVFGSFISLETKVSATMNCLHSLKAAAACSYFTSCEGPERALEQQIMFLDLLRHLFIHGLPLYSFTACCRLLGKTE